MIDSGSVAALSQENARYSTLSTWFLAQGPAVVAWLFGALAIGLLASASGGFLPTSWDWTSLITLWLAAVTLLLVDRISFGVMETCFAGGLAAYTAWVAASNLWTTSMTSTMHEVQRNLAYFGLAFAGLLVTRQKTVPHLLGGVLSAITAVSLYSVGTRLLPDRLGSFDSTSWTYRLSPPITYWNGLGLFAVMGLLLALAFATRATHLLSRAAAAAALPVLSLTMYFTFSRGAWAALAVGLGVAVLVDPRRLQLIALGLLMASAPAVAIELASGKTGLTTVGASLQQATGDGHALVIPLLALSAAAAVAVTAGCLVERRAGVPKAARRLFALLIVGALLAGIGGVWVKKGSPWDLAQRGWTQFQGAPTQSSGKLSKRLFQVSGNGRVDLWKVSLKSFEHDPLLGHGAGTFGELWAKDPNWSFATVQAHSLYLATLGELGIPGLLLLALALLAPLVGGVRHRARPLVPGALGAYAAWLVHAGVDWDWQLTGVSAVPLLCGVAVIRSRDVHRFLVPTRRFFLVGSLAVLSLGVAPLLSAERSLQAASRLTTAAPQQALSHAGGAERWEPWSSEPLATKGYAYLAQGRRTLAISALQSAITRDRSNWRLWNGLSNASSGRTSREARVEAHRLFPSISR